MPSTKSCPNPPYLLILFPDIKSETDIKQHFVVFFSLYFVCLFFPHKFQIMTCKCLSWWDYDDLVSILVMIGTVVVFLSFVFLLIIKNWFH